MIKSIEKDLNYLNMKEIRNFCIKVGIPYKIHYYRDNKLRVSGEIDRKSIILDRIRQFLKDRKTGEPTIYSPKVVCFEPHPKTLQATDHIYFGQYKTTNKKMLSLLRSLTDGAFKFGAISQILIRDFWRDGNAPTYEKFAKAWIKANKAHDKPREEWAFLTDLASGMDMKDWKKYREEKAKEVLRIITHDT